MNTFFDILAAVFLLAGIFFFVVGALGVVRLPDVYHRLHAASKSSTLGLIGLLLAATCHMGTAEVGVKALAVMLFLCVANPIGGAHAPLHSPHVYLPRSEKRPHRHRRLVRPHPPRVCRPLQAAA